MELDLLYDVQWAVLIISLVSSDFSQWKRRTFGERVIVGDGDGEVLLGTSCSTFRDSIPFGRQLKIISGRRGE